MGEIDAVPWNGGRVVSTFSGAGGSCLGYRMAGLRVVWANEFVPAAQDTYRANHPETYLDTRDIREVQASEIMEVCGFATGELDLFDGSPPCTPFSAAGKRERGWQMINKYADGAAQRTDDLFFEYVRLLRDLQPKTFVAENVAGLVRGVARGYFKEIIAALRSCGYVVACKLLDAQWLGVPQSRQRTIFVGVRADLAREPAFPSPLPYRYSIRDALPCVVSGKYGPTWKSADAPSPTVSAQGSYNPWTSHQGLELVEVESTCRIVGVGTSRGMRSVDDPAPTVLTHSNQYTHSEMTAVELDIGRFAIGREWERLGQGEQSSRYFNPVRPDEDAPSPTICASHGQLGIAGVTHPNERRKLTMAELRRLCGFPDDFILTGTYAQQWMRLGNSVPPVMMHAIASVVRDEILGLSSPST